MLKPYLDRDSVPLSSVCADGKSVLALSSAECIDEAQVAGALSSAECIDEAQVAGALSSADLEETPALSAVSDVDDVGPSSAVVQGRLTNSEMLSKLDECFLHLTQSQHENVTVTQLALGESFKDDAKVLSFRKNHDAIWSEIGKGYLDGSLEKSSSRKGHYEKALSEMESVLLSVAKERKAQRKQTTFVDALLQSSLTERQIMEECMVFTQAGCVITANLCIWALHFLSTSEELQNKLYQELDEVLGSDPVTLDKIPQLRYCQQVLNETVRTAKLTPVAARLQGVEGKVDQHVIPKETLVIYALGVVLQDSDAWSIPYRFDPDRFEEESVRKTFCLLGFSGNQTCPELRFAYTVATVLLSTLVRQLKLHQIKGQVMEVRSELVSTPKDETWITVSGRSQN
ncbi:cytochrome P450 20A1 isoform X3 [Epinephelus fuscoguttatus]|uniref:cytochrome P450 20A1 isoform X3 n=1 Tax=Epinephelus fuscoguttatus TaxID=293821 RepID=UPI0020D07DCF|nr:cytochrome P450 20A1 isoform X3 [Epinephelus fuscoguttatus]